MVNAWKYQGPIFKKMFSKLDFPKAVSVTMTTNIEKSPSCLRPLHFLFRTLLIFPKDFLKNCLPYSIFRKCLPFTNRGFGKRMMCIYLKICVVIIFESFFMFLLEYFDVFWILLLLLVMFDMVLCKSIPG